MAGAAVWCRWGGEVTAVLEGQRVAVVAVGGRPFSGTLRRIVGATVGTAVAIGPTVANSAVAFASTGQETPQLLDKQLLQVLSEQAQRSALWVAWALQAPPWACQALWAPFPRAVATGSTTLCHRTFPFKMEFAFDEPLACWAPY